MYENQQFVRENTQILKNVQYKTGIRARKGGLRYEWYAQQAKAQGYVHIGQLFDETAEKEQAHGEMWLRALGEQTDTARSLDRAAEGEREEWAELYAEYARIARQEGFAEIAGQFEKIAAVERGHEQRFRLALSQMQAGQVFHLRLRPGVFFPAGGGLLRAQNF